MFHMCAQPLIYPQTRINLEWYRLFIPKRNLGMNMMTDNVLSNVSVESSVVLDVVHHQAYWLQNSRSLSVSDTGTWKVDVLVAQI